jgi:hypothetical protein
LLDTEDSELDGKQEVPQLDTPDDEHEACELLDKVFIVNWD